MIRPNSVPCWRGFDLWDKCWQHGLCLDGAGAKGRTEGKEPGRGGIEGNYDGDKMPDEADEQYDEDEDVDDETLRVNDKEDKEVHSVH
jgi:hypothetical protein